MSTDRSEASRTDKLLELSRRLAGTGDLQSILSMVIDALRDLLDADRATVFEYDPKADELFTQVAHGLGGSGPQVIRIPAGAGIAGAAARGKHIVNIPDAYADERFNRAVDQKTGYRTRTILAIPLLDHDGVLVGVAQVLNRREGAFDASDEALAEGLAANAAVAVRRGRLIEDRIERAGQRVLAVLAARHGRDLDVLLDVLLGENWRAGGNCADERQAARRDLVKRALDGGAGAARGAVKQLHRARLGWVTAQHAELFQVRKVSVDG